MTWTRTPPTRPGWYWYRRLAREPVVAEVVQVLQVEAGYAQMERPGLPGTWWSATHDRPEWAGPIEPPEEVR